MAFRWEGYSSPGGDWPRAGAVGPWPKPGKMRSRHRLEGSFAGGEQVLTSDTGIKTGLVTLNQSPHPTSSLDRQPVHSAVEALENVFTMLIRRHRCRQRFRGKVLLGPGVSEKFLL